MKKVSRRKRRRAHHRCIIQTTKTKAAARSSRSKDFCDFDAKCRVTAHHHRVCYKKRGRYIFRIIIVVVVVIITREEKQGKSTSRVAPLSYSLSLSRSSFKAVVFWCVVCACVSLLAKAQRHVFGVLRKRRKKRKRRRTQREREVVCAQKALFFCVFLSSWGRHERPPECLGFY